MNILIFLRPLLIVLILSPIVFGQKPFQGMLEYKITARDTNLRQLLPDNRMVIFTNDTISRTENFTPSLGRQVFIRHMELDKGYILVETTMGNFAIKQLPVADSLKTNSKYSFKKKMFKRKILGMKANRMMVSHKEFEGEIEFLYLKRYANKYLNNFPEIPGLLVKFSIVTVDGVLDYELIRFSKYHPDRNLFGIPSDYKRVTMDEFLDIILGTQEGSNGSN